MGDDDKTTQIQALEKEIADLKKKAEGGEGEKILNTLKLWIDSNRLNFCNK